LYEEVQVNGNVHHIRSVESQSGSIPSDSRLFFWHADH
jgi:hypothetical protein